MKRTAFTTLVPLALLIISLTSLSSCKKDTDGEPSISIKSLSGSYKLAAWTSKTGSQPEEDFMIYLEDCEKDDIATLNTDKTYNTVDAGLQCTPPTAAFNSHWDLPSTTKIILGADEWTIESFDGKTLKISQSYTSGGTTEIEKMTLNKQ
jgi:hypothetical protein